VSVRRSPTIPGSKLSTPIHASPRWHKERLELVFPCASVQTRRRVLGGLWRGALRRGGLAEVVQELGEFPVIGRQVVEEQESAQRFFREEHRVGRRGKRAFVSPSRLVGHHY